MSLKKLYQEVYITNKLSNKKTNFLFGYFLFISERSLSKYSSKYSFFVPPPLKNLKSSTPFGDIVAVQVKFSFKHFFLSNIAGLPILE